MPLVCDAIEQFLASLRSRRAPTNTIKSYHRTLQPPHLLSQLIAH